MSPRLCVIDVDTTLITSTVVELMAERAGTLLEVTSLSEAAMRGELDFSECLSRQVATFRGLPITICDNVLAAARLTPGAQSLIETLHGWGWVVGLVSEGFTDIVGPLASSLGISRVRANALESIDGILTGRTRGPLLDAAHKAQALKEFASAEGIALKDTVAIGDNADDLALLTTAGLGIAFNAKPIIEEQVDLSVTSTRLDTILEVLDSWES